MNLTEDQKKHDLQLRTATAQQIDHASQPEPRKRPVPELLHELEVRQVELEMQNEALREMQMALLESRDRYADLYEFAPAGYLTLSADGVIAAINLTGTTLLGKARNELLKRAFTSLVVAKDMSRWTLHFRKVKQGGGQGRVELALQRGDGTVLQAQLDCVRADGSVSGLSIVLSDITERKQAELELRRFKSVVDSTDDAIISKTMNGIIVSWNPAAEKIFGYTAEEAIGKQMQMLIPPDRTNEEVDILARISRGDRIGHFETVRRRKDGQFIHIAVSISAVLDEDGSIIGVSKIARDITERKQAEAKRASLEGQVRESQKMEAIGTLAGGIAHDFNNILAIILGNADLAQRDLATDPVSVMKSVEEIRKAGNRARSLAQQILTFSRRQTTERTSIVLAPVIEECVRLLRKTLPPRVAVEAHCAADVPPVLADATQIQQVLINLATNAMHAMQGEPGRIQIRLDTFLLDAALAAARPELQKMYAQHPGRCVRLAVSDDGSGMDAATREKIFEPFFTTKPVNEGTGLGLSVVHGILQTHEGAITVDSTPGAGTTFTLYLPVAATGATAHRAGAAAPAPALRRKGGQHILYLDDDEHVAFYVRRMLERDGFRVSSYTIQRDALAALRADPAAFDLVVTDYNMPGMSGVDVAREVRLIRADLPVAVASGFISEGLQAECAAAGVRELIYKTNTAEDLTSAIKRLAEPITGNPMRF